MIDKKAYTEVYKLIEILPEELKKKIPEDFIDVIKNNMDTSYKFEIDTENIEEIDLLEDTEKILSVIYTDYLATEEERRIIKNKEKISFLKKEQKKKKQFKENYNDTYYNFPKETSYSNNKRVTEEKDDNKLINLTKDKWYQKFIKMIRNIIKK
jgi:hypothetical protein